MEKLAEFGKIESEPWDLISLLPDEILVDILRLLAMKDAAITSVLSKRWVNLWKFASVLDFDATKTLNTLVLKDDECHGGGLKRFEWQKLLEVERDRYVKWVNQVLELHRGSTLSEFRVCFDLDKVNQHDIDNWIRFAFARSVQTLELDLLKCFGLLRNDKRCYVFSADIFGQISLNHHREAFYADSLKSLRSLCLRGVNVSGEVLQCFLSNIPNLERLIVHGSNRLVNFEVSGRSLMLKHLEISHCHVKSIKISDVNLVSFTYLGAQHVVTLDNLPMLVDVRFNYMSILSDVVSVLSSYLHQIKILTLESKLIEKNVELQEFPIFTRLEQLVLVISVKTGDTLMGFSSLLKASPYLQQFVLEVMYVHSLRRSRKRKTKKLEACPHANLRVVELSGYSGRASDMEAAMYILENAVALEHLIVDPRDSEYLSKYGSTCRRPISKGEIKETEAARKLAKSQLVGKVPSHIKLSIL